MLDLAFGFLFPVDEAPACPAGSELAGFIGGELVADVDFAFRQLITRGDGVQFQTKETVGVLQSAFFDVKREAAKKTAFRDDHARYSGPQPETCSARIIQVCADAVHDCKSAESCRKRCFPFRCNR